MLIKVKFDNDEEIELNIDSTDTINRISRKIQRKTGIPQRLHVLRLDNDDLPIDDSTAADHEIYAGAVLFCQVEEIGWVLSGSPGFKLIRIPLPQDIEIDAATQPDPGTISVEREYGEIQCEEESENRSLIFGMISVERFRYPPEETEQLGHSKMEIWVNIMLNPEHRGYNWEVSIDLQHTAPFSGSDQWRLEENLYDGNGRFKLHGVRPECDQERPVTVSVMLSFCGGKKRQFRDEFIANASHVMEGLNENRESSGDVKIISTTGTQYPVHSVVLAQHSPMFRATFEQQMKEKQEQSVKLDGYTDKAIGSLIQYLYTGWTPAIVEETFEVLKMAHMYQVQRLVDACWDQVKKSLSEETVFESLIMAELFDAKKHLKHFAEYMMKNHEKVRKLPAFEKFVFEKASLYVKVCQM